MNDSGNKDVPNSQPPDSQPPERSMFQSSKPKPPPRDFFADEPSQPDISQNSQEERFREAAIRLAVQEEEISELIEEKIKGVPHRYIKSLGEGMIIRKDFQPVYPSDQEEGRGRISLLGDPLLPHPYNLFKSVDFTEGYIHYKEGLGIETNKEFRIRGGILFDEEAQEAYGKYVNSHPTEAEGEIFDTYYYITPTGEYRKIISMPKEISLQRDAFPVDPDGPNAYYLSEMTPGDFETVGGGLDIMRKKLTELEPDKTA